MKEQRFFEDYPERVYAGWLGKLIGIRLGAPIEGMTYQKILDTFGPIDSYLIDYDLFAADDDSNGPLFFVRALEDGGHGAAMCAQDVAEALLNYAAYEHGFFWWGGYGVSTEHTAYLNLRHGFHAPESGSADTNGIEAAEQIGGQIFSDCWGLICPGDAKLAAKLAGMASQVTHDGNAVFGGMFIAACISLAFTHKDMREIIEQALSLIPVHCEYQRMARHVIAFYDAHPDDWRLCFQEVEACFGYDKYPGACHVIPNAAIVVLSLLYGGGDFDKTLCISCMCGWDTDCNAGNVGAIVGVFNGTRGIDFTRWRKPINDFLACSSVLGSLNITDAASNASYMARLGYSLAEQPVPEQWRYALSHENDCVFPYDGSTQGMRIRVHPHPRYAFRGETRLVNTDELGLGSKRALKAYACRVTNGQVVDVYKRTYLYQPEFQDSRYDPAFSPTLYPGERITGRVMTPAYAPACNVRLYVALRGGACVEGETFPLLPGAWQELSLDIPASDALVEAAGFRFVVEGPDTEKAELCVLIDSLMFVGKPNYELCFSNEREEYWRPTHREITQCTRLRGQISLDHDALCLSGESGAEVYTGSVRWDDYTLSCRMRPVSGLTHLLLARVQGAIRSYAFGFSGAGRVALIRNAYTPRVLKECAFEWQLGRAYTLSVTVESDTLSCAVDGQTLIVLRDTDQPYQTGAIGFSVGNGCKGELTQLSVRSAPCGDSR